MATIKRYTDISQAKILDEILSSKGADMCFPHLIGTPKTLYRCVYDGNLKSHAYDNPVDACVAMVEKLNELNLL